MLALARIDVSSGSIAGVVITVVFVPSVAVATIARTFIKGYPSNNRADVTGADQLLTTTAQPQNLYSSTSGVNDDAYGEIATVKVATPPAGDALILDHLTA